MNSKNLVILIALILCTFSLLVAADDQEESTDQEKIAELKDQVNAQSETLSTVVTDVDKMKKLKISGYIQAQYEKHEDSQEGINSIGTQLNLDNFQVRRGRIKFEYAATDRSKYVLQIDAARDKLSLKDAYVELTARPFFKTTMGQFKWPFGYEVQQSSSEREMPERARGIRLLFPDERDRGIKFSGDIQKFNYQVGLFNGGGIADKIFTWQDSDGNKDIVGRLGLDLGKISFGLSGYSGQVLIPGKAATPGSTTWYDADGDGTIDEGEYTTIDPKAATPDVEYDKERVGGDIQWYYSLPVIGGGALKFEFVEGKALGKDVEAWWGLFVQSLGDRNSFAFRVDSWDPNKDTDDDEVMTYTPAWLFYWDAHLKFTLAYEMPKEKGSSKKDNNAYTFRLQYKF